MAKRIFLVLILAVLSLILINSVYAVPGIPHQFYGDVFVNNNPASDNNLIFAVIGNEEYKTITTEGKYGISPNTFFVQNPLGDNNGKTINFYVGKSLKLAKPAGSFVFESNKLTKLDFNLQTTCGDGYCLGDETCSNCEVDCGICTEPPKITIYSPENNKIYTTSKIDLRVSADQEDSFWLYALNSAKPKGFEPNITLTVGNGTHSLQIIAINNGNIATETVYFTAIVPICGDGICESENGETCSNCPQDCGVCPTSGGSSGGGGSGGGSGGGGGVRTPGSYAGTESDTLESSTEETLSYDETTNQEETYSDEATESTSEETQEMGTIGRITGAVTGFLGKSKISIIIVFVVLLVVIFGVIYIKRHFF